MGTLTQQLVDKYQPHHIQDFVGLDDIKKTLTGFIADPYPSNWLFSGAPGLGKTSMAMALAADLPTEDTSDDVFKRLFVGPRLIHYYSNDVDKQLVHDIKEKFALQLSHQGYWTVYLIDEVDEITHPAHISFLGLMENLAARAIVVFTCNSPDKLPDRLMDRCHHLKFSNNGIAPDLIQHVTDIWAREAPPEATPPNFARLVTKNHTSVRGSIMELETLLMALKV